MASQSRNIPQQNAPTINLNVKTGIVSSEEVPARFAMRQCRGLMLFRRA